MLVGAVETNQESNSKESLISGSTAEGVHCEEWDLEQLVRMHGSRVQRFCIAMTGDRDEALDLAQDVFVVAIERKASFRGDSSVETWLLGIAVRVCRSWNRRRAIGRRVFGLFAMLRDEVAGDTSRCVDQRDEIALGLGEMDVKSREVLVLRYFEGREVEEMAKILKLSRGGVDQRLTRARRKLADWLEGR